ncbi:SRPBCC domain-containing protein [Lentzea tibetensis]|uniref:SRPBCC domain-containing protein n=1 Tax=Lentzea tibetensis TaxID=2591470 RepID=A0A563ESH8_9PSEU|nr:SRPBCC domain-containing protein [Lentzea tibetensis]TWP50498.1 SRPBCC domain-containing protein [Lentzea tibetensis]
MRFAVIAGTTAAALLAGMAPASADPNLEPREPSSRSLVYRVETSIAAEPARIWQLLVDLPGYESWNPWVVQAQGRAEPGAEVRVKVVLGKHTMAAQHVVLKVDAEKRFCWKDAGWNAWFVYGQRCRTLTAQGDGTVLVKNELLLDGLLSGAAGLAMGQAMRNGMAAENAALKQHAEVVR